MLFAACLVPAGCGGAGDSTSSATPITYEELAQSATTSADAASGRFSFAVSLASPGADEPFALSGEGAFDEAAGRASFAVDMSSFAALLGGFVAGLAGPGSQGAPDFDDPEGWKIEVVQDGEVGYVRFPAFDDQLPAGKSWIRTDGESARTNFDFDGLEDFAQSDPREVLESLRGVTSDVEVVGTETLRGVSTTHYRAVVAPRELADKAPTGAQDDAGSLVDELTSQSGVSQIPLDVWIDESGLVRKLSLALSAKDATSGQPGDVSLSFELWDYEEPVEIELPPADEVVDASDVRR
jgi:hypothetical protein